MHLGLRGVHCSKSVCGRNINFYDAVTTSYSYVMNTKCHGPNAGTPAENHKCYCMVAYVNAQ